MTNRLLLTALAFAACAPEPAGGSASRASGSVALSRDDALVYAVDADLDTLFVVSASAPADAPRAVRVGRAPVTVVVAPDDTVYVANRFGRTVSVVRRGDAEVALTLAVGVEPFGLAVSADGHALYVVNAARRTDLETGSVMAFDTATHTLAWETAVGPEPRALTLLPDGTALVALARSGDVVTLDLSTGAVTRAGSDLFRELNRAALARSRASPDPVESGPATRHPRSLSALTTSADGAQVYAAAVLSTDEVLNTRPGAPTATSRTDGPRRATRAGYGAASACGRVRPVVAPALLTFDATGNAPVDDASTDEACGAPSPGRPPLFLTSTVPGVPVQGPAALALAPDGARLFVANRESNNVSVVPTRPEGGPGGRLDPRAPSRPDARAQQVVSVGAGPTGVAVSRDGRTAWVFNAFDHSLSRLTSDDGVVRQREVTPLGRDVLPPDVVAGRALFFSASSPEMNDPALGLSCASCHPDARDDGHVWNTSEGPRDTPSLAGRLLARTAPFHWNGEFATASQFLSHTTRDRMGGRGPSSTMEAQLMAFLMAAPAPDNPFTTATPPEVKARGRAAWAKAACGTCHSGEALTDGRFHDVGTLVTAGPVVDRREFLFFGGLNTPSLLGIARTAPFLHDGSAPTLEARLRLGQSTDAHGRTSALSPREVDDLVAYVRSL
ncbi:MAG: hypothetical protein INH37_10285 [Myxococcaceae bacterium]|nr:hypothetical protein [Myxococcaceae bacterium]